MIAGVLARHSEVAAGYLFGSVARGDSRADSDLDVGVVYSQRGDHDELTAALAHELALATGFERVDVVDLDAQGPIFAHRVLLEGRRVHESDRARRVDFESDTLVRAFDFRPTYEIATRGKIAALRRWLRDRYDIGTDPVEARHGEG